MTDGVIEACSVGPPPDDSAFNHSREEEQAPPVSRLEGDPEAFRGLVPGPADLDRTAGEDDRRSLIERDAASKGDGQARDGQTQERDDQASTPRPTWKPEVLCHGASLPRGLAPIRQRA